MVSSITWLDHDSKARDRSLRILSLFQEKESRDELGLGGIRDSFADQLFPGTSTIQTRLRYMFFIPWIYQDLENKGIDARSFGLHADKAERDLIDVMKGSDERLEGVFGGRSGRRLKRLPSSVYWAGLGSWGLRQIDLSRDQYHRNIDYIYQKRKESNRRNSQEIDSDSRVEDLISTWHASIPSKPASFPNDVDFTLSRDEADYILERLQSNHPRSLLTFLACKCEEADVDFPWMHPDLAEFSTDQRLLLKHAQLFSETLRGAALIYNLSLSRIANREDRIEEHTNSFHEWREALDEKAVKEWPLTELWKLTLGKGHTITSRTQTFVSQWVQLVRTDLDRLESHKDAVELVSNREIKLKKARSRFKNKRALDQWGGSSGTKQMNFRWPNVQVFLRDLQKGSDRESTDA